MAKWASAIVLDGGSDAIRARAATPGRVKMHVLKAYAMGDSYATVIVNSCAVQDMDAADYVQSGGINVARVTTVAAKSNIPVTADSGPNPDLHIAHVDSTAQVVLYVANETGDQQLYNGNTVSVQGHAYSVEQPT